MDPAGVSRDNIKGLGDQKRLQRRPVEFQSTVSKLISVRLIKSSQVKSNLFIYEAHLKTAHADQSAVQLNHNKIKYQNK